MKTMLFRNKKVAYSDQGSGKTIVLLHGFTEDMRMWSPFAAKLARGFRVIRIDLPGHGSSQATGSVHTMESMADLVHYVLRKLKASKCLMVGHSMGGYVTLAFAEKYPGMLKGFCLFHSHVFPDSETDKENRVRMIALVDRDKFGFLSRFIPSLFPDEVRERFEKEIRELMERASGFEKEGIRAALEGLKARSDKSHVLKNTSLPVLFILGMRDPKVPVGRFWEMLQMPPKSEVLLLRDCGHMGYIEDPAATLKAIDSFADRVL